MSGIIDLIQRYRELYCEVLGEISSLEPEHMNRDMAVMIEMIRQLHDVLDDLAGKFAEAGVHTAYPDATYEAAEGVGSVADQLAAVFGGLPEDSKPGWVQPARFSNGLRHIDPRDAHVNVWKHWRGGQG